LSSADSHPGRNVEDPDKRRIAGATPEHITLAGPAQSYQQPARTFNCAVGAVLAACGIHSLPSDAPIDPDRTDGQAGRGGGVRVIYLKLTDFEPPKDQSRRTDSGPSAPAILTRQDFRASRLTNRQIAV